MEQRDRDAAIDCAAIVAFVAAVAWLFVRAVRWVMVMTATDELRALLDERYMELPLDADGVPIRVGDVMEFSAFEIEKPVTRMVDGIGQGVFFAWCGERGYQQHEAKRYRHHHEPTVEDVLREMCLEIDRRCERGSIDYGEFFAEYAAKLQLKEG